MLTSDWLLVICLIDDDAISILFARCRGCSYKAFIRIKFRSLKIILRDYPCSQKIAKRMQPIVVFIADVLRI